MNAATDGARMVAEQAGGVARRGQDRRRRRDRPRDGPPRRCLVPARLLGGGADRARHGRRRSGRRRGEPAQPGRHECCWARSVIHRDLAMGRGARDLSRASGRVRSARPASLVVRRAGRVRRGRARRRRPGGADRPAAAAVAQASGSMSPGSRRWSCGQRSRPSCSSRSSRRSWPGSTTAAGSSRCCCSSCRSRRQRGQFTGGNGSAFLQVVNLLMPSVTLIDVAQRPLVAGATPSLFPAIGVLRGLAGRVPGGDDGVLAIEWRRRWARLHVVAT